MAEGIAQKWLDDHHLSSWLAVSAGTLAIEGIPTSCGTVESLSQRGIDFDGTSSLLTKKMVTAADLVLCMSTSHFSVAEQYGGNVEMLDPSGSIADPIGQEQIVYDELAKKLETLITKRLEKLVLKE